MDLAHRFLQQEAGDARAGVDGRQNEQRLEHDGEVIPVFHQPSIASPSPVQRLREDQRHAHRQRYRAAGAAAQRFAADHLLHLRQIVFRDARLVGVSAVVRSALSSV